MKYLSRRLSRLLARTRDGLFAGFAPLAEYPAGSRLGDIYSGTDLSAFVNSMFKFGISIGAILAVLRLVYAGYMYMGTDMWSSKGKAREIIGDVIFGLLILLAVYLILYQINPDILKLNILRNVTPLSS